MDLIDEGWLVDDEEAAVGVSRKSVYEWKKAVRDGGRRALRAKPQRQSQCRLSQKQRAELVRLLKAGPREAGFDCDLWTLPRVATLIQREFGISYNVDHLSRLVRRLGFSCQKPERRSKEQDPQVVAKWSKTEWPAIKKGRARSS